MNAVARKIAVIGLGYVGLPVAVAFSRLQPVIAYDKNSARIRALKQGYDACGEVDSQQLRTCQIDFTDDPDDLAKADFYIVAVPTPIDQSKHPDLSLLLNASETIGRYLKRGISLFLNRPFTRASRKKNVRPFLKRRQALNMALILRWDIPPNELTPATKRIGLKRSPKSYRALILKL